MFALTNLVRNEFFPKELPPCFTTSKVTDLLSLEELETLGKTDYNEKESSSITFSGYKAETARRKFSVPNYIYYIKLAKLLTDNSEKIFYIFEKANHVSLTAPIKKTPDDLSPYIKIAQTFHDSGVEIEKLYYENLYELHLDISSFFDSIYTHSIAWAVEGKHVAKDKQKDMTLLGNKLDCLVRKMNLNQTNGILIGNALSRIISEIILCTIDENIQRDLPNLQYRRYVDDYYIFTSNGFEIPNIISIVRKRLNEYGLSINENKIQISESPFIFGKPWIESVRQYIHLDPLIFLNHIIIEYKNYKDVSLLRYGLKVISLYEYSDKSWKIIESKILNLLASFPSLADVIIQILILNKKKISKRKLKRTLYSIIDNTINLSYDQELIWMTWYIKVFNIDISIEYSLKILNTENTFACIILLDYLKRDMNNTYKNSAIRRWREKIQSEMESLNDTIMRTKYWLLAYEGTRNKWFNGDREFKKVNTDSCFKFLLDKKVQFYLNDFEYEVSTKKKSPLYATREEVIEKFNELKNIICNQNLSEKDKVEAIQVIDFDKFEKILASNEY
ncbi:MAG: RNA-directed DNA polymerase [Ruminiclostridium sp.]|nr:RNA-directed DNA polymerase [Ruminiclostridium sp.]